MPKNYRNLEKEFKLPENSIREILDTGESVQITIELKHDQITTEDLENNFSNLGIIPDEIILEGEETVHISLSGEKNLGRFRAILSPSLIPDESTTSSEIPPATWSDDTTTELLRFLGPPTYEIPWLTPRVLPPNEPLPPPSPPYLPPLSFQIASLPLLSSGKKNMSRFETIYHAIPDIERNFGLSEEAIRNIFYLPGIKHLHICCEDEDAVGVLLSKIEGNPEYSIKESEIIIEGEVAQKLFEGFTIVEESHLQELRSSSEFGPL